MKDSKEIINKIISSGPNLHYQGFHDALSEEVVGYEALLREDGNPAEIIRNAEELSKIGDVGLSILKKAVLDTNEISGKKIISINASRIEISENQYAKKILKCLEENQKSSQRIMIEVTETTQFPLYADALRNLHELIDAGVLISIDDFGVDNASIYDLLAIPASIVKIDASFITNNSSNYFIETQKKEILYRIADMIKSLDKKIIMEGIEYDWQKELALSIGADYLQGYFLSKPSPIKNIL